MTIRGSAISHESYLGAALSRSRQAARMAQCRLRRMLAVAGRSREPAGRVPGGDVHELSIAHEILRTCRGAVAGHGPGRLETVRVAVGELSAIEPELLRFAWEALTAEGPDAGSRLDVEWRPARQHCLACGEDKPRSAGTWLRVCPDCGAVLEVDGGDELDVLQLTFVPDEKGEAAHG
jgi:hydrogenase nickel incorporation protein HypA/HybF